MECFDSSKVLDKLRSVEIQFAINIQLRILLVIQHYHTTIFQLIEQSFDILCLSVSVNTFYIKKYFLDLKRIVFFFQWKSVKTTKYIFKSEKWLMHPAAQSQFFINQKAFNLYDLDLDDKKGIRCPLPKYIHIITQLIFTVIKHTILWTHFRELDIYIYKKCIVSVAFT